MTSNVCLNILLKNDLFILYRKIRNICYDMHD